MSECSRQTAPGLPGALPVPVPSPLARGSTHPARGRAPPDAWLSPGRGRGQSTSYSEGPPAGVRAHRVHTPGDVGEAQSLSHNEPRQQRGVEPRGPAFCDKVFAALLHLMVGYGLTPTPTPARALRAKRGLGLGEAPRRKHPHRLQCRKCRKFIYGCGENMARVLRLASKGAISGERTQTPRVGGRGGEGLRSRQGPNSWHWSCPTVLVTRKQGRI